MKFRLFFGLTTVVFTGLLAGCAVLPAPSGDITVVTFTFETFDTRQQRVSYPVDSTYSMPDVFPMTSGPPHLTPFTFQVSSKEHPSAAREIDVTVHVVAPPGIVVVCTWSAQTPSGVRSSERSRGGEGSAAVPDNDGTEAIAYCKYQA